MTEPDDAIYIENERKRKREFLRGLPFGSVLKYRTKIDHGPRYLFLWEVDDGVAKGQIRGDVAFPTGTNHVSIDELLNAEELSVADFKEV